jgi:hypothetical protein
MSDNSFGLIDRAQFAIFLDKQRCCMRCSQRFTLRHNLGQLKCPGYHPLPLTIDGREYGCCRRRAGSKGCCGADHLETIDLRQAPEPFEKNNRLVMTFEQFRMLAIGAADCEQFVQPKTWMRSARRACFVIDRIDFARYYEQRNVMIKITWAPVQYGMERWRPDRKDIDLN